MDYLSEDEVAAFRDSGQFDEQWYVEEYPDVKLVGIDPAKHYLWLGARLGRKPSRDSAAIPFRPTLEDRIDPAGEAAGREPEGGNKRPTRNGSRGAAKILTPEFRSKVEESGLFDSEYYLSNYRGRILTPDDLLADYISAFGRDLDRDPGRLFSTRYYVDTHRDVKNMHPFVHYIEYGMNEGRAAFSPEKVNAFLSEAGHVDLDSLFDILPRDRAINILYWEEGNFFFTDVARYLERLLTELGYDVSLRTDSPTDERLNLVVAPHEYCACGPGKHWTAEQYAAAVYVSTEQWQTSWFALSLKYLQASELGVLDLNPSSAQGLVRIGLRAAFLPLLPLPGSCFDFSEPRPLSPHVTRFKFVEKLSYPERLEDRPYDVLCCGVLNERRSKGLASMAPVLASHRCFIHTPRFNRPIKPGDPDVLSAEDFAQIARNSKIMLNIHQGDSHYIEWQRMFLIGMMQGAVVVSEPCYPNDFVMPDVHYVEASLESMPAVLMELLTTEAGREKMAKIHANVVEMRQRIADGERLLK